MTKLIINVETGEIIERQLNAEELAQQKIDEANNEAAKALADAESAAKAAKRAQLLSKLGITEEEARILLG